MQKYYCIIERQVLRPNIWFENFMEQMSRQGCRLSGQTWWCHQMETFSALLTLCAGNSSVTGEFPSQRAGDVELWCSLICAWTNGRANNRDAGDLRRHRAHYDVTVNEGGIQRTLDTSRYLLSKKVRKDTQQLAINIHSLNKVLDIFLSYCVQYRATFDPDISPVYICCSGTNGYSIKKRLSFAIVCLG